MFAQRADKRDEKQSKTDLFLFLLLTRPGRVGPAPFLLFS